MSPRTAELAKGEPFAMSDIRRTKHEDDGSLLNSFIHFALHADEHPLLRHFHTRTKETRSGGRLLDAYREQGLLGRLRAEALEPSARQPIASYSRTCGVVI